MKTIRYDKQVDALYIDLSDADVYDTHELEPGIMVDYDKEGRVIGIEVLDLMDRIQEDVAAVAETAA